MSIKLPSKLEKKRDELAPKLKFESPYTGFIHGFNAACEELLPLVTLLDRDLHSLLALDHHGIDEELWRIKDMLSAIKEKLGE